MLLLKKLVLINIILALALSTTATAFAAKGQESFENKYSYSTQTEHDETEREEVTQEETKKDFIKWIDLNTPSLILDKVLKQTIALKATSTPLDFFEALAYLSVKNGNKFNTKKDLKTLDELIGKVKNGESITSMLGSNKYYKYYLESYNAIFGGIIGTYSSHDASTNSGDVEFGVRGFFPLANGYWYKDYDDFGNSRSFGFKRKHLGHDMQGSVGTPIIAVEGGTVTELGWNRYGGWRIGIRSNDTKRYYYYAHLRKDKPYPADIKLGDTITAGQVVGYLGNTGYSNKENVNMSTCKPHLHFGLQIIFDKSQEKGSKEIWVDVYELCRFLSNHKAKVTKNAETKEYISQTLKTPV